MPSKKTLLSRSLLPRVLPLALSLLASRVIPRAARADDLAELGAQFWDWRARQQPFSEDDIPHRLDRPADFSIDWSASHVSMWRKELAEFEQRWKAINVAAESVPVQVDYRLIGSALARVHWELDLEQGWQRNPMFYVQQTLGAVQILLLQPPPLSPERQAQLVARVESIPATVQSAQANLISMRRPFALLAIDALDNLGGRWAAVQDALSPLLDEATRQRLLKSSPDAIEALNGFRTWLQGRLDSLPVETAIGREKYEYFLKQVALLPYTPEQVLAMGTSEWARSIAFESYEHERDAAVPPLVLLASQAAQIALESKQELQIRDFFGKAQSALSASLAAPLSQFADPGLCASLLRVDGYRRPHQPCPRLREWHQLHPSSGAVSRFLRAFLRQGSAAHHRPRGRARSLHAARHLRGQR